MMMIGAGTGTSLRQVSEVLVKYVAVDLSAASDVTDSLTGKSGEGRSRLLSFPTTTLLPGAFPRPKPGEPPLSRLKLEDADL